MFGLGGKLSVLALIAVFFFMSTMHGTISGALKYFSSMTKKGNQERGKALL